MALSVPDRIIIADEVFIEPKFHKAFYAISNQNGTKLETTYQVLTWGDPTYADSGFGESGGVITVLEQLDGARARIDFAVSMANASNNTLHMFLGIDPDGESGYSPARGAANYGTIGASVDSFHYIELAAGMKLRVQAKITGSTGATIASLGTQLSIETKAKIAE